MLVKRKSKWLAVLTVMTLLVALLPFAAYAASVTPTEMGGNDPTYTGCAKYKIDPAASGTYSYAGGVSITVTITKTKDKGEPMGFDWSSNIQISKVYVKAGSGGNLYEYSPAVTGDTDLVPPGQNAISHITFYYCGSTDAPNIELVKSGTYDDYNDDGVYNAGDKINYTFTVTNTGNVTLTNITVTDPVVTVVGGPIASLASGASDSTTFTAVYTLTKADIDAGSFTNTATATGHFGQTSVSDTDSDTQLLTASPAIELVKSGTYDDYNDDGVYNAGDKINYTFTVTNTGNVTLANITVTDPVVTVVGGPIASLVSGASDSTTFTAVYTLTQADIDAGSFTNTATATGHFGQTSVSDTDSDTQLLTAAPAVDIEKYVSADGGTTWLEADSAPGPTLYEGTNPQFRFVVTNTGNVALYALEINDDVFGLVGGASPLAPGGVWTVTYTGATWSQGQHANTATVTAYCYDPQLVLQTLEVNGPCVSDSDMAHYYGADDTSYFIHGYKFNDLNNNGADDDEPGLGSWTINLWTYDGEGGYDLFRTTTTDSTGYYRFDNLCCETEYYITEGLKAGWNQTYPKVSTEDSFAMSGHGRGWGPVQACSNAGVSTALVEVPYCQLYAFGNYRPFDPPGPTGTLTVIVVKTDGGNVSGLTVNVSGAIGSTLTTNASGTVTLGGLYAGTYTANSGDTGYTSDGPKSATLPSDSSTATITITLTPAPPLVGALRGIVLEDETGDPLPGASVTIYGPGGTVFTTLTADSEAKFFVDNVPPGAYTALGTLAGYTSGTDGPVTVVAGEVAEMLLVLAPQQIIIPPDEPEEPEHPKTGVSYLPNVTIGAALMLAGLAVGRRRGRR